MWHKRVEAKRKCLSENFAEQTSYCLLALLWRERIEVTVIAIQPSPLPSPAGREREVV
jgi:hypothetical protein